MRICFRLISNGARYEGSAYKVAYGTKNMAKGPAMTREEAVRALEIGIAVAEEKIAAGYQLMATGEMGIGNTTTSSEWQPFS